MTAQPPAGVFAIVGKERPDTELVGGALLFGFHPMVFKRGEQELRDLHAAVTCAAAHAKMPDGPVSGPEQKDGCEQPEHCVGKAPFELAQQDAAGGRVW